MATLTHLVALNNLIRPEHGRRHLNVLANHIYYASGTTVRLVEGGISNQGRVEVLYNGVWGTVCDDYWDTLDAQVVCRSLGYSGGSQAHQGGHFPEGQDPIHLDDVSCNGNEDNLEECQHQDWDTHNCRHVEDAGVSCT